MYIAQSLCHSIIAFIIVDRVIYIWNIKSPLIRLRFRLIVVLVPILSFPIYQLLNPERNSISFRMGSLFDINRWIYIELFGFQFGLFFIAIFLITTFIFLFQELIPVIKHTIESRNSEIEAIEPDENSSISHILDSLGNKKLKIFILDDDEILLFSTTGSNASVYLSRGAINTLNTVQLKAAIAHEIAHIERNKRPLLTIVFILRVLMFFNPIVLLEFRKIVQEEEMICDDMAVSMTKDPHALSESLKKIYHEANDIIPLKLNKFSDMKEALEQYSHNMHLKSRIIRLEKREINNKDVGWFEFVLTLFAVITINYFIV